MIRITIYSGLCALLFCACNSAFAESELKQNSHKPYEVGTVKPVEYIYEEKETFSVLSWNVEHFLDAHDDPYIVNDRENASAASMKNRVQFLVDALKQADADIVVLQEFEGAKFLRQIATDYLSDMGYEFFADAPSHGWYMNVVVMSRFPLGVMYSYGNATTPLVNWTNEDGKPESQRNVNTRALSIDVYPAENYNFLLTAVHLKAGRGERNIAMRLGQIEFLKGQFDRFLAEDPDRNIMMVGDFNATPESTELKTLLGDFTQVGGFIDPMAPDVLTHPAVKPTRRLDYIIYNKNMQPEVVPDSVKPTYFFKAKKQDQTADHLPVLARFYLSER